MPRRHDPAQRALWIELIHVSRYQICETQMSAHTTQYGKAVATRLLYQKEDLSQTSAGVDAIKRSSSDTYGQVQADWIVFMPGTCNRGAGVGVYVGAPLARWQPLAGGTSWMGPGAAT